MLRIAPMIADEISGFARDHRLSTEDEDRLLRSGLDALEHGVLITEVLRAAILRNADLYMKAVRSALSEHIAVREPWHPDIMVLTAAQPYLRSILPDEICANLAFTGAKSSGKTTATKLVTKLAGGRFYVGGSPAALRDLFGNGLVGLDEVDTQSKRDENLQGILRTGNAWNATYPLKIWEGNRWTIEERNIGGPKVFNFRGKVDDALLSRCYVIDLPRQTGGRLVVNNLYPDNPILPLADLLRHLCERAIRGLTKWDIERRMKEPAFIARLDTLPPGLARSQQTAAVFLAISDILGLGLDDSIRKAAGAQSDSDAETDEFREWASEFYASRTGDPTMPDLEVAQADLFAFVCDKRRAAGLHSWTRNGGAFTTALREAGFAPSKKRSSAGGKRFVRFDPEVRNRLGISAEPGFEDEVTLTASNPRDIFEGRPASADESRAQHGPRETEMERAVRTLGPTITYPDGTVTDRRTGEVLKRGDAS